jgi:hypothetical protein
MSAQSGDLVLTTPAVSSPHLSPSLSTRHRKQELEREKRGRKRKKRKGRRRKEDQAKVKHHNLK